MNAWLLSIAGVVVVGVLIELILTDSPMAKFVRSIYAFFILFVIFYPLPGFLRDAADNVGGGEIEINQELVQTINNQKAVAFTRNVENALNTAGFENILIMIEHDRSALQFTITTIHVNAWGVVLRNPDRVIDIRQDVIRIVRAVTGVSEDVINFWGQG